MLYLPSTTLSLLMMLACCLASPSPPPPPQPLTLDVINVQYLLRNSNNVTDAQWCYEALQAVAAVAGIVNRGPEEGENNKERSEKKKNHTLMANSTSHHSNSHLKVYIISSEVDEFWLNVLMTPPKEHSGVSGSGSGSGGIGWLANYTLHNVSTVEELILRYYYFRPNNNSSSDTETTITTTTATTATTTTTTTTDNKIVDSSLASASSSSSWIRGAVVYDPHVYSTSLVASTIAGLYDLVPVSGRVGSPLLAFIERHKIPILFDLRGMFHANSTKSGKSAKNEALQWAIRNFLSSNKNTTTNINSPNHSSSSYKQANGAHLGYYLDYYWTTVAASNGGVPFSANTVLNQDYFIMKRGFFFDLDPWPGAVPNDDPHQVPGTDYDTMVMLFAAAYAQQEESMVHKHKQQMDVQQGFQQKTQSSAASASSFLIHLGGFPPWAFKYINNTNGHGGVQTEWEFAKIASSYNIWMDADACCVGSMANAALFSQFPIDFVYYGGGGGGDRQKKSEIVSEQRGSQTNVGSTKSRQQSSASSPPSSSSSFSFHQNPTPTQASLYSQGLINSQGQVLHSTMYSTFYVGDYDSAAWAYSQLPSKILDPARGTVKLGWALTPQILRRFPVLYYYFFNVAKLTPSDRIISGDSGWGYLNPSELLPPRRSGIKESGALGWTQHCQEGYRILNMSFTGFIINGASGHLSSQDLETLYCGFSDSATVVQQQYYQGESFSCPAATGGEEEKSNIKPRRKAPHSSINNLVSSNPETSEEETETSLKGEEEEGGGGISVPVFQELDLPPGSWQAGAQYVISVYNGWQKNNNNQQQRQVGEDNEKQPEKKKSHSSSSSSSVKFQVFRSVLQSPSYHAAIDAACANITMTTASAAPITETVERRVKETTTTITTRRKIVFVDPLELALLWRLKQQNGVSSE